MPRPLRGIMRNDRQEFTRSPIAWEREDVPMNRRILFPVTVPVVVIGLLLCGTCLVSAWYIHRLQANLANLVSDDVLSLQAAQELEIRVRQLRFHCFLYLFDPKPQRLVPIEADNQHFEEALRAAEQSAGTPEERNCVRTIAAGYQQYRDELAHLREEVAQGRRLTDVGELVDAHPIRHVVEPCQQLLHLNQDAVQEAARENARVGGQANLVMWLLGIVGPLSGLVSGHAMARGLSQSICRLSIRIQDIAQRLDQDVASVSLVADSDIPSLDQQLQHVLRSVEEVTERMQRQQRDMLRAEQLAAVGQLAASVAHEVRNPLTAVKMLVELAIRPRDPKPLTLNDLQVIHREVTRLERTVQGFLDFARLPTPQQADCDLRDVVREAVELIQTRARQQQVEVLVACPDAAVPGFVDRNQIGTVLVNLCLNALDAMPHGGRLDVRLEASPLHGVCLSVSDTGGGIAPGMAERLFTPFASSKPTGTGLGLSISQRIVEEHGGRLTATNCPEGGACFRLQLAADGVRGRMMSDEFPPAFGPRAG
jgi:two-component system sensor histidine kinase HydH